MIKARALANPHAALDESLEEIGWRIAEKCNGLPLAAEALGALLAGPSDARERQNIENNGIWNWCSVEKEIPPALMLTYEFLPALHIVLYFLSINNFKNRICL